MLFPHSLRRPMLRLVMTVMVFSLTAPTVFAQNPTATWSQDDSLRIAKEVQKQLGSLDNIGVFDWITFGFQGKTIVLKGFASRPGLKSSAGKVVKGIKGVESVDNQIVALPPAGNDDRLRSTVYSRIYTQPSLRKYNANQGSTRQATGPGPSVAQMAGGITNDPPRGFHAIHIIVNNGHITLYGYVITEGDSAIAEMQANTAPGAFSVDNNLVVEGARSKSE